MAESDSKEKAFEARMRRITDLEMKTPSGYFTAFGQGTCPLEDGVSYFAEFISDPDQAHYLEEHTVTCLMDAIALWVSKGDAIVVCGEYEFYLRSVICIIAMWNGEGGATGKVSQEFLSRTTPEGFDYDEETMTASPGPTSRPYEEKIVVLPTLVREGSVIEMWNHPALSKDFFEYNRRRRLEEFRRQEEFRRFWPPSQ